MTGRKKGCEKRTLNIKQMFKNLEIWGDSENKFIIW